MQNIIFIFSLIFLIISIYLVYSFVFKTKKANPEILKKPFPENFRKILEQRVLYYRNLSPERKKEFEERVKQFIADKKITGVDTEITDTDKVLVAASAIIPMFAFPYYKYPNVKEVLLYPHSFDEKFQTSDQVAGKNVLGMVGDGFMNGSVVLSRPDLEKAFDGSRHRENVGIHEFIHLIDKADGATDGIPEILFDHSYVLPWLKEIKKEMAKIKTGKSDIRPYALTNNAEFLAVVSEYFFDNPEKMKSRHPELYNDMVKIFNQDPEKYV